MCRPTMGRSYNWRTLIFQALTARIPPPLSRIWIIAWVVSYLNGRRFGWRPESETPADDGAEPSAETPCGVARKCVADDWRTARQQVVTESAPLGWAQ